MEAPERFLKWLLKPNLDLSTLQFITSCAGTFHGISYGSILSHKDITM